MTWLQLRSQQQSSFTGERQGAILTKEVGKAATFSGAQPWDPEVTASVMSVPIRWQNSVLRDVKGKVRGLHAKYFK